MFKLNNLSYGLHDYIILTVFSFVKKLNITIPHFCYHHLLSIAGNCRVCMVEVINNIKPVISCATMIIKNMLIFTNSELIKCVRENVIEFLLINHPLDCPVCDQAGECDLQDITLIYGVDRSRFVEKKKTVTNKFFNNIIKTTMTRCINCTRRIRYANEIAGVPVIATLGKGINMEIGNYINNNFLSGISANIIDICPVGALNNKLTFFQTRNWELHDNVSIDLYDSLNQNIVIKTKENKIVKILPSKNNILNMELITDNARFFYLKMKRDRVTFPIFNIKTKKFIGCSWKFIIRLLFGNIRKNIFKSSKDNILFADDYLDYLDLEHMRKLSCTMNCDTATKFDRFFNNNRKSWLVNISFKRFNKIKNLFFFFLNLEEKSILLNAQLVRFEYNMISVNSIGIFFNSKYKKMRHLFVSMNELNNFFCNKVSFKKFFKEKKFDYFITNMDKFGYKFYLFKLKFNDFTKLSSLYHYITHTSTEVMTYDLSLNSINLNRKHYNTIHYVGTFAALRFSTIKYIDFLVFQVSNHMKLHKSLGYDVCIYLPVKSFYENRGIYYNMFFQKQISNPIITGRQGVVSNSAIFNMMSKYYIETLKAEIEKKKQEEIRQGKK